MRGLDLVDYMLTLSLDNTNGKLCMNKNKEPVQNTTCTCDKQGLGLKYHLQIKWIKLSLFNIVLYVQQKITTLHLKAFCFYTHLSCRYIHITVAWFNSLIRLIVASFFYLQSTKLPSSSYLLLLVSYMINDLILPQLPTQQQNTLGHVSSHI